MGKMTLLACCVTLIAVAAEPRKIDYRVLATSKTSTMEKEMNEAADAGYAFRTVMGGETAVGGDEVVVVMAKPLEGERANKRYKLLGTKKTSTMQKELQQLGDEGFLYRGQTVFDSAFGGREVVCILERDAATAAKRVEYLLLATKKTSTLQKELLEAGDAGFELQGMTVASTTFGGSEVLCILSRGGE
jgi:hypothetical protein